MSVLSTTRLSLLLRIRDSSDAEAWAVFVRIYGPLVHRYGLRHGLQDADAADLVQDVLREITRCIGRFDYDPSLGKFRSWLLTVARYSLSRMRRLKTRQASGTGDSRMLHELNSLPDENQAPDAFWEEEYEQRLFEWAAEEVRPQVKPQTWDAFWMTAVECRSPDEVADRLGMKVGSVYVAKNRILNRLRNKIREIDDE